MISGHSTIDVAVQAIKEGAYDFIEKPFSTDRLIDTTKRAIEKRQLTLENLALKRDLKTSQTLGTSQFGVSLVGKSKYGNVQRWKSQEYYF